MPCTGQRVCARDPSTYSETSAAAQPWLESFLYAAASRMSSLLECKSLARDALAA